MTERPLSQIDTVVVHCADTPNGDSRYKIEDIKRWHIEGNGWSDIGYHCVIHINGSIAMGLPMTTIGSHCRGHNTTSLGVCLIGRDMFTLEQWASLRAVVRGWVAQLGPLKTLGHRDLNSGKTCPGFSVARWVAGEMRPINGHTW